LQAWCPSQFLVIQQASPSVFEAIMEPLPRRQEFSTNDFPSPQQLESRSHNRRASDRLAATLDALSADDVAALLGCEPQHINALAAAHAIPAVKFGRSWRFPASALNAFIAQQAMANLTPTAAPEGTPALRATPAKKQRPDLSRTVRVA
jgi:excisionase family DNA binding protein